MNSSPTKRTSFLCRAAMRTRDRKQPEAKLFTYWPWKLIGMQQLCSNKFEIECPPKSGYFRAFQS